MAIRVIYSRIINILVHSGLVILHPHSSGIVCRCRRQQILKESVIGFGTVGIINLYSLQRQGLDSIIVYEGLACASDIGISCLLNNSSLFLGHVAVNRHTRCGLAKKHRVDKARIVICARLRRIAGKWLIDLADHSVIKIDAAVCVILLKICPTVADREHFSTYGCRKVISRTIDSNLILAVIFYIRGVRIVIFRRSHNNELGSLCIVVFCKDPVKIGEGTFVLCLTCAAQCHISAGEDHKIIQLSLRLIGVWSAVKQIPHVFCIGIGARSAIACNIKSLKVVFRGCVISK